MERRRGLGRAEPRPEVPEHQLDVQVLLPFLLGKRLGRRVPRGQVVQRGLHHGVDRLRRPRTGYVKWMGNGGLELQERLRALLWRSAGGCGGIRCGLRDDWQPGIGQRRLLHTLVG